VMQGFWRLRTRSQGSVELVGAGVPWRQVAVALNLYGPEAWRLSAHMSDRRDMERLLELGNNARERDPGPKALPGLVLLMTSFASAVALSTRQRLARLLGRLVPPLLPKTVLRVHDDEAELFSKLRASQERAS
jgi:hypothetical protein